ncbi:hypothetical protein [Legionella hackeliae]|uniref:C-type lysozyme inhibitor domain-containing protein n=1 Tax=Legionella hackeliae TaxID=449 RepID=A0A0A8UXB4_LEGHA|nr:hypothetical protein [Legionella hackeliae]KTD12717.1 hypothetical protein Lhac_1588 [Legionella hackeliae]CEK12136.1 exported protein of unknown function [Legionella hackeliae]STX48922.1 Uncharacterised protein [Legionella hackeliae]
MKKIIILLLISSGCFADGYPNNITGLYKCKGSEIDTGLVFFCKMNIKKTQATYDVITKCNDGTFYLGTGIYDVVKHNLSLIFMNPKNKEETGVAMVDIKEDGTMTSVWTHLNKTTLGHMNCGKSFIAG